MALFGNDGGVMDSIRCDEQNYLIWKWHPQGTTPQMSQRANAIRFGSSLRVRDGSVAVFVYAGTDGNHQDYIEGPFDGIVETNNFPVLATLIGKFYAGGTPFPAEVYFINRANLIQIKFGVPYFDIFDPRFTDYGIPVAVRGAINFRIADYRQFIKLHRLDTFNMGAFQSQTKAAITRLVKEVVANAPSDGGIPAVQIERHLSEINSLVEAKISPALYQNFGVEVVRLDISDIEINKDSAGYKKLQALTQNKANMFTQAAANIVDTIGTHRTGAKRISQTVKEEGKPIEGGINLEELGKNVTDTVGDAANAIGKGISDAAGALGGFFGALRKDKTAPPPIPIVTYYVVIDGAQTGPYPMAELEEMVQSGALMQDSLVWTEGMSAWQEASNIEEVSALFEHAGDATTPPPPLD